MSETEDEAGRPAEQIHPDASAASNGSNAATPATSSRSIVALLGGQPRAAPAAAKPDLAKRRRKNADKPGGPTQGRIVLSTPGSTAWGVGRQDDADTASVGSSNAPSGKGKGRAGDGEEEELKEMDKRNRASRGRGHASRGRGAKRRTRLPLGAEGHDDDADPDYSEEPDASTGTTVGGINISPSKKRGRPRKTKAHPTRNTSRSASTARDISPEYAVIRSSSPNDVTFTGQSSQAQSKGVRKPPPLSRANTASNSSLKGVSQQDPIDLEADHKPGPRKIAFASDAKPTHAFFSRLNQAPSSRATSVSSDQTAVEPAVNTTSVSRVDCSGGATQPADAGSRPFANGTSAQTDGKNVHSFFQSNGSAPKAGSLRKGWGPGLQEGREWLAPWPGRVWPVHEGRDYDQNGAGPSMPRRPQPTHEPIEDDGTFWRSVLSSSVAAPPKRSETKRDRRSLQPHPGDRETFCERFRPRRASQVLGNVTEASYLRDWLAALSIGAHDSDGPKVMRRLPKRRPRMDDWIVDDIGPNGLPDWIEEWDGDEVPEPYEEPELPLGQRPDTYTPLSMRLANSILLTGPSGSGKSAAVYAAATELDWEVFEVYPGIGKRTGGNLMSLVGDVGRNHMVSKGKEKEVTTNGAAAGLKSFLNPRSEEDATGAITSAKQGEPIEVDDNYPDRPVTPPPRMRNSSVHSTPFRDETKFRQSLILIEEVDILFEEESTFWPAVIALIAESRRPIVMTCNDVAKCPFDSLPLQSLLRFEPPEREAAVEYLSSLCGHLGMSREDSEAYAAEMYDRAIVRPPALLNGPGPPNGHEWLPHFDLRRAIMQLQLERVRPLIHEHPVDPPTTDLQQLVKVIDMRSLIDAHLDRPSWETMEINELDRYEPNADDQLGVATLVKPGLSDEIPILPAYNRTSEIAASLIDPRLSGPRAADLLVDQIKHIRTLLPLLDPIIPLSSYLLPHPALFTDYMPAIRTMIQIDDVRQSGYDAAKAAGEDVRNYKTGRPMRLTAWMGKEGFTRELELDNQALSVGRQGLRY